MMSSACRASPAEWTVYPFLSRNWERLEHRLRSSSTTRMFTEEHRPCDSREGSKVTTAPRVDNAQWGLDMRPLMMGKRVKDDSELADAEARLDEVARAF